MLTRYDPRPLHVYTDQGRFYHVGGDRRFPGVGTILSATETAAQKAFWEQWQSEPQNVAKSNKAKERGTYFHKAIEHHFLGELTSGEEASLEELIEPIRPFWSSVESILSRVTDPMLVESALWHEIGCYAGTVDMVCQFDGVECILDWKTAEKPKRADWLGNYPLQLAAYCGAVNRMYGLKIRRGVLVFALPNKNAQVFKFDLFKYWCEWLHRLVDYWENKKPDPLAVQAVSMISSEYLIFKPTGD